MGLFDFFKKNTQQKNSNTSNPKRFTKEEVDELVLSSLNILCDDVSTAEDVIKSLKSKGYNDRQAMIIAQRSMDLYQRHFAGQKQERNTNRGKTLNDMYAEQREQNNGSLPLNIISDKHFISREYQMQVIAMAQTVYFENDQDMGKVRKALSDEGLNDAQVDVIIENLTTLNAKITDDFEEALSTGRVRAEFSPNPAHQPDNVGKDQIDRYIGYGAFQLEHKNYDNALEMLNKAIELGDKTGLAYANLGSLHKELGNLRQSIENYDKAIQLSPTDARLYCNKALVLEELGDFIDAKLNYEKAIKLDATHTIALNNLGVLQIGEGNYSQALYYFDEILAILPDDMDALTNKISVLIEVDVIRALELYVTITNGIDLSEIENIIGRSLLIKYPGKEAISFLEELYNKSKNPKYIKLQSLILFEKNRLGSFELLNKYLSINPKDQSAVDIKVDLAFELMPTIGEESFIKAVEECLALDNKNPTAINYKIQILLKQHRVDEALDEVEILFLSYYQQQEVLTLFTQVYNHLDKDMAMLRFERFSNHLNRDANYQLGYMKGLYLKGKGYYEDAILAFSMLNEEREFSWNYYQIAIMDNLQGNIGRCLLNLKKTFELEPGLKEDARNYSELKNLASNINFLSLLR